MISKSRNNTNFSLATSPPRTKKISIRKILKTSSTHWKLEANVSLTGGLKL